MQSDYKERVMQEAKELAEKTASLHNFIEKRERPRTSSAGMDVNDKSL